jgi:nitronate monooxygenase
VVKQTTATAAASDPEFQTPLTSQAGIRVPLVCGAMYPCSNIELVAAASEAGGIGIVQPVTLTYVFGHEFRDGLRLIRSLTSKPIGMNALIESSSRRHHDGMVRFVEVALEEGIRFFVTSLGNPRWVVDAVHSAGGFVWHDVTEHKWALKGRDAGVDGLIAVNRLAGGHAGSLSPEALLNQLVDVGLPVVAAGGVSTPSGFAKMLALGYAGVQMGTRFIATQECSASDEYKQAIVAARSADIVLTERLSGVPLAVLNTPHVRRLGTRIGPLARLLFRGRRSKRWIRTFYRVRASLSLKRSLHAGNAENHYWQAGKSVEGITEIATAGQIVRECASALPPQRS